MTEKQLARFVSKIRFEDRDEDLGECWIWAGTTQSKGYGELQIGSRTDRTRRKVLAHRLSYEHFVGPIPADRELDHLCRNKACVHPRHLEGVTHQENTARGMVPIVMRRRMTGKEATKETRAKLAAAVRASWVTRPRVPTWLGGKHTEETRAKMRAYWARRRGEAA